MNKCKQYYASINYLKINKAPTSTRISIKRNKFSVESLRHRRDKSTVKRRVPWRTADTSPSAGNGWRAWRDRILKVAIYSARRFLGARPRLITAESRGGTNGTDEGCSFRRCGTRNRAEIHPRVSQCDFCKMNRGEPQVIWECLHCITCLSQNY